MRVRVLLLALLFLLLEAAPGCSVDQLVGSLAVVTDGGDVDDGGVDSDEDGGYDGDEDGGPRDGGYRDGGDNAWALPRRAQ